MSELIRQTQPLIDIRDYAYIPISSQYQTYRSMIQEIGLSFYKTQKKIEEYHTRKSNMGKGDVYASDLDMKIARLNRHLAEYDRFNRIIGELMNLEEELVEIIQPVRLYCDAHMTYHYILSDAKKFVELQNKYKQYMEIRRYIQEKRRN